ncbi:MAG: DUF4175 family protein [Candidatus Cyclobacteriaceae bacterium M2_1C_046]
MTGGKEMSGNTIIDENLNKYKKKLYKKLLFKGLALFLSFAVGGFLLFTLMEYHLYMGTTARAIIFFGYLLIFLFLAYRLIIRHLLIMIIRSWQISDDDAARDIGALYPEVGDRLLNMIQLKKAYSSNSLAQASISQRSNSLSQYDFTRVITYKDIRRHWQLAFVILFALAAIWILNPGVIVNSSERIAKFNQSFAPAAPFSFEGVDNELVAFKNEDFTIAVKVDGEAVPEHVYLETSSRRIKMSGIDKNTFSHTFQKIQQNVKFQFEAAGFKSSTYTIKVVSRPQLGDFNVVFEYPSYLNRTNDRLENTGNLQVPEGTKVTWQMQPRNAGSISFLYYKDSTLLNKDPDNSSYASFTKVLNESSDYEVRLKNAYSENKEKIIYRADVIPDQYPQINLNLYQDTVLYSFIMMSGNLNDDYGLTRLNLFYRNKSNTDKNFSSVSIPIARSQNSQSFNYNWMLDTMDLQKGQEIEYFLQVWDNDGVNGAKASKTGTYIFKIPTKNEIKDQLDKTTEQTENQIDETLQDAKELTKALEDITEKLKGKKEMNWQEKQQMEELLKKKEELNKALEEMKKKYQNQEMRREKFNQQSEKIKEKVEQLQKMMDELLDEETRKLYEELKKLLEEQQDVNQMQELLNKMQHKEKNLEKELERTMELFKRLKFDHKLEETVKELDELAKEQKELSEKSTEKNQSSEELSEEQKKIQEDFEETKESVKEMEELNQQMENPESLPEDLKEQQESIEEKMQEAQEELQKNKPKKAGEQQKKAAEEMQEMKDKLSQMQGNMEMEMMMENLNDLRHIVHNLLKLSFDQEKLMKEFNHVQQSDPRFVTLAQEQLKIKDDSKIVKDSLHSLANRVFQIQSFVTRELSDMDYHLERTTDAIKERKKPIAVSEQQFTMTSMNNLALLLDDVMQQMQNALAEAMGKPKPGNKKSDSPSLGELQQQLNNKIEDLKKSGKSGRPLSEELAKLAAEQERIRKALQEMMEKHGQDEGKSGRKPGNGIPEKMEETEMDLVNKQITSETIRRQREILTRLLEAEESLRERELDEERKGESANPAERELPPSFEEYFKQKRQEIELLKTIPPKLFPYYRKEVNEYFKRLGEQAN